MSGNMTEYIAVIMSCKNKSLLKTTYGVFTVSKIFLAKVIFVVIKECSHEKLAYLKLVYCVLTIHQSSLIDANCWELAAIQRELLR